MEIDKIYQGDSLEVLKTFEDNSIDCCVTSPPYYALRDYGADGQIGLEETPEKYIERLTSVFMEVHRVLKPNGTLWLNIGDSYWGGGWCGSELNEHSGEIQKGSKGTYCGDTMPACKGKVGAYKPKDLIGVPWMLAFSLRSAGWYLRQDIIWCLSGGVYVWVKSKRGVSPMMIKDLVRLDPKTVKLWNGDKWVNVLGYSESTDKEEKIEIVLRSGERIGCTGGHKWVLKDGNEVLAKNLKIGDVIKTCTLPNSSSHTPSFMTKDLLWFLGLYLAEGSLADDTIQIALNSNEVSMINRIEDVAKHLGGTCTHTIDGNKLNVRIYSQVLFATLHQYIGGKNAKNKHLNNICWSMPNEWLKELIIGYFDGDGHYDKDNNRIRIGFTRNYDFERDLRVLASRLGAELTLNTSFSKIGDKSYPSFRGEWRWCKPSHLNSKDKAEIVSIRKSRARHFYDISVDSEDHLFSLASGVLTHNCKPNPMPESVKDRCTKSHEYIFLLSKSQKYYFDYEAIQEEANPNYISKNIRFGGNKYGDNDDPHFQIYSGNVYEPKMKVRTQNNGYSKDGGHRDNSGGVGDYSKHGHTKNCQYDGQVPNTMHLKREEGIKDEVYFVRNKRDVWSINVKPNKEAHFATYPPKLVSTCILAGCPEGGVVLDPFIGSGTTGIVANKLGRHYVGIELNPEYVEMAERRIGLEKSQLKLF